MAIISFQEVAKRITGVSIPLFGVSWEPPTLEVDIARSLITYMEDKRVLFAPYAAEHIDHVIESIVDIRKRLTTALEQMDRNSELAKSMEAMRAACRRFMTQTTKGITIPSGNLTGQGIYGGALMYFFALGELRSVIGFHLAQLSVKYGIDVEEELVSIFPSDNEFLDEQND